MGSGVVIAILAANVALLLIVFGAPRIKRTMAEREQKRMDLLNGLVESTKAVAESQVQLAATMNSLVESYAKGDKFADGVMNACREIGSATIRLETTVNRFIRMVMKDSDVDEIEVPTEEDRDDIFVQHEAKEIRLNTEGLEDAGFADQKKTPGFE